MPEKDPTTWAAVTWTLAIVMAVGGGAVNWYQRVKKGHIKVFNFVELIGECFLSGFVGLAVFMLLAGLEYPQGVCAGAAGICGHMGTRLLFAVERLIEARLEAAAGKCKHERGEG